MEQDNVSFELPGSVLEPDATMYYNSDVGILLNMNPSSFICKIPTSEYYVKSKGNRIYNASDSRLVCYGCSF